MSLHLIRQMDQLKQKILFVGSLVEEAIANAVSALNKRDEGMAQKVLSEDDEIDRMEVEVEEECLKILALYQPVASDLRFVIAVLKINNDLERMGDLAKNIAKRVIYISRAEPVNLPLDFHAMAERAQEMVKLSLDALVSADAKTAREVRQADDSLDKMRRGLHEKIRAAMRTTPDLTESLLKYYSIAKHLERIGDMAVNVAEDVTYMVEGEIVRHRHLEGD